VWGSRTKVITFLHKRTPERDGDEGRREGGQGKNRTPSAHPPRLSRRAWREARKERMNKEGEEGKGEGERAKRGWWDCRSLSV